MVGVENAFLPTKSTKQNYMRLNYMRNRILQKKFNSIKINIFIHNDNISSILTAKSIKTTHFILT